MNIGDFIDCYWSCEKLEEDLAEMEIVAFDSNGTPMVQDEEGTYSTDIDEDGDVLVIPSFVGHGF